jgi:thimet oligopeptidase
LTYTNPPDFLVADPLAQTPTAPDVVRQRERALAHGRALAAEIRALSGAGDDQLTFDAVFGRLDEIQYAIRLVKGVGQVLGEVHPDGALRNEARASVSLADELETEVFLDPVVGAAMKRAAARLSAASLDAPKVRLMEHALRQLKRNGLDLPPAAQGELRRLNTEISQLGQAFERNLTDAAAHIEAPPSALEGLPEEYVAAHLAQALPNGNVVITTDYPDLLPFVKYARDRRAARDLYAAFDNRASAENVPLLERLLALRERKARILGYESWADYAIEPRMARDARTVRAFLETVRDAVKVAAEEELAEFRAMHEKLGGRPGDPLYPPDRYYLEEKVRAFKHGYDSRALAQYLEVDAVKRGLLELTSRLFGIEYRRVEGASAWHPDVEMYDVLGRGVVVGRVVLDLYPRPHKFKLAGAFELRPAWRAAGAPPIAALLCNLPRPGAEQPALLAHEQLVVFFHEFGHVLHQILSESPFATFAGEAVARDFVEAPSQVFEEWAYRREVLDLFARHHRTGAMIPDELFAALTRSRRLGLALWTQVQLFVAALDLEYHSRPAGFDSTAVLREVFAVYQPFAFIEGTHYQATFQHLISYDAGYYGYQWAQSLAFDVLTRFREEGFLNPAVAADWQAVVLSRGGSEDEAALVQRFLGRAHDTAAYIQHLRGDSEAKL